mgnify:CR=1 FL=1
MVLKQFTQCEGPRAIMHTNMGDITIQLYPEVAPKTVENFVTLAKKGYYNGLIFHRVIKDFMIQGGDPTGTGAGGESIYGAKFEDECSQELHNFRGALSMANAGPNTNGSQFFVVQAKSVPANLIDQMEALSDQGYPTEVVEQYKQVGGTPWLDFHHTVFGQLIDGADVLDAIAAVPCGPGDKPVNDVVIDTIEVQE